MRRGRGSATDRAGGGGVAHSRPARADACGCRALAETGRAAGLRIGLYLDLAVGEAPDGSATWSDNHFTLPGVVVGAPPDVFSQDGQNWALSALSPTALARAGYAPSPEELADAAGVVAAYEQALVEGRGAAQYRGAMIDAPVVARAREILATHDKISSRAG